MAGDNFAVMLPRVQDPRLEYVKHLNFLIALRERRRKATVVCAFPFDLTVDLSMACQLRCPLCPTGARQNDRPRIHLKAEMNQRIIETMGESAFLIWYYSVGEPLLNPRHAELIAEASRREIFSVISTNLSLPLSDVKIDSLLRSGLGMLCVALDGATPETYAKYRRGGKFQLVLENLKRLVYRRRQLGLDRPIIEWRFLLFRHNQHEVARARQMAAEIGVDNLDFFRGIAPVSNGPDGVEAVKLPVDDLNEIYSPITTAGMAPRTPRCGVG